MRKIKTLAIKKVTLRNLDDPTLESVAGASFQTCPYYCPKDPTVTCPFITECGGTCALGDNKTRFHEPV
jgi:hypothetical protein